VDERNNENYRGRIMKLKGYKNKARIRQRREEAIERQKSYDDRTPEQRLKLIKTRSGESKKENYKLVELIEKTYNKSKKKEK